MNYSSAPNRGGAFFLEYITRSRLRQNFVSYSDIIIKSNEHGEDSYVGLGDFFSGKVLNLFRVNVAFCGFNVYSFLTSVRFLGKKDSKLHYRTENM